MRACEQETAVARAAGSDELTAELAAHAASCPDCRETLEVAVALRRKASEESPRRLPTASQLWWKARIVGRLAGDARLERANRPLAWGLGIGGFAALVGLTLSVTVVLAQARSILADTSAEPTLGWLTLGLVALATPAVAFAVLLVWLWREA